MGVFVGQLNDIFAVIAERFTALRFDDDSPVGAIRFLETGMAVIPVGARLLDGELVGEGLARRDAVEADGRHAVHIERQDQAVPVDGRGFLQVIGDVDGDLFAFLEAKLWPRQCAVITDAVFLEAAGIDGHTVDADVIDAGLCRPGRHQGRHQADGQGKYAPAQPDK